jgi:tRNA(Ile)-lysidine synthase
MRGARPHAALIARVAENVAARPGETLAAAVSGGPDSAALSALLAAAAASAGATLVLLHVNHGVRPTAWQDEAVVLALGATLGVTVRAVSLPPGSSAEARLRDERYAALETLAAAAGARRLFTAHHAADQTETVLLALFRGTGPDGLTGMPASRPLASGVVLERPLLGIEPEALAAYCAAEHLPYARDPSNADPAYRRNAVREALAALRPSFPHLDAAVARCTAILREERAGDPVALARRELRSALATTPAGTRDLTYERLTAAAKALQPPKARRHYLRHGVELIVE